MASEKKPSIYSDRGSIGSSDELDEYGVWVKSEPQDLSSELNENQGIEEIIPDIEDLPDFEEEIFPEQEKSSGIDTKMETEEDLFVPDIEDLPDFDFSIDENALSRDETDDTVALSPDSDDKILDDLDDLFDISGIDPGEGAQTADQDRLDFEDLPPSMEPPKASETAPKGGDALADIFMEDFPGDVPGDLDGASTAPRAEKAAVETEQTEPPAPREKVPENKKPELDLSTQLLMKIADELASIKTEISSLKRELSGLRSTSLRDEPGPGDGFLDEKEEDEKLSLTGAELDNILNTASFTEEVGADAAESTAEDLIPEDKIETTGEDVPEPAEKPQEPPDFLTEESSPEEAPGETAGIDTEEAFPDEISFDASGDFSVSEDVDLSASEDLFEEDLLPEEPPTVQEEFPEEGTEIAEAELLPDVSLEDDSLSLEFGSETEDASPLQEETAVDLDFTGSAESDISPPAPEEDAAVPDVLEEPEDDFIDSIDIDISDEPISLPLGFEYTPEEETLPEELPPLEASPELQMLQHEGVEPMTPAPDDTRYLDEAAPAENGFDEEILDLSNAVIDEPDLSGDVVENPIQEPSLESISLDLELEESLELPNEGEEVLEFSEEAPEEISIDIPEGDFDSNELSQDLLSDVEEAQEAVEDGSFVEEENFAQVVPEDFVVEADDSQLAFDNAVVIDETTQEEPLAQYPDKGEAIGAASEQPNVPDNLKQELKVVLSYMDQLLESLPEEKIEEFARSEYYDTYKKLFEELGLV
ncbi:MAG: hypothetical protein LBP71_02290 [Spirochaetaceae bacterium]|jgi:hypothetical protein|nr:hypothetical protein [Spirochaetaceae bacterium]